jgi:hypothetical protein
MNKYIRPATVAAFFLAALTFVTLSLRTSHPPVQTKSAATLRGAYAQLPLSFEANAGQTDSQVRYLARGNGYTIFLTANETVLSLHSLENGNAVVRLRLDGSSAHPEIVSLDELTSKSNYFIGNDPKKWHTNVPLFSKVRYQSVYSGIDVVYHGNQRQLEYDFVIAPNADPGAIKLDFAGVDKIDIDDSGDLVLKARAGKLVLRKPVAYQDINGRRQEVSTNYILNGKAQAGVKLAKYDASTELVIDPVFLYSTYLGGSGNDQANAIAVDALGNAYVAGQTNSFDFPVTPGAPQGSQPSDTHNSNPSAFVTKLNPSGNQIIYSTYLGGSCTDIAFGIAIDAAGEAYVTGTTGSGINPQSGMPDCGPLNHSFQQFPQVNAFQTYGGNSDAFVTKLNAAGNAIIYSSFLGGGGSEFGRAIAVDALGNAYVTGDTISGTNFSNFPTTPGAFQTSNAGGEDAFVTKISYNQVTQTTSMAYSTYLGGGSLDSGRGIAVDANGLIYVTGLTGSGAVDFCNHPDPFAQPPFPTTAGAYQTAMAPSQPASCMHCCEDIHGNPTGTPVNSNLQDAFISKINPAGAGAADLVYSTYFGGGTLPPNINDGAFDEAHAIALDSSGNVYITGVAGSATSSPAQPSDFPTKNAFQSTWNGGNAPAGDGFIAKLQLNGTGANDLIYSSYLGNKGSYTEPNGIAVDAFNNAYVGGTGPGTPILPPSANTPPPCPMCPPISGYGAFYAKIDSVPTLQGMFTIPATQFGFGIGVDALSHVYLAGNTLSGLTTVNAAQPNFGGGVTDGFVVKIGPDCIVAPPNMISWWQGENNTIDIISGNNGSWIGNPNYAPGEVNTAFKFDGASYVTVGNPASLNITGTQVTIDGWINPSVTTDNVVYFGKTAYGQNDYVLIFQFNELTGMIKTGSGEFIVGSTFVPPLNQWTHIALTYDGSTAKLYANGVMISSGPWSGSISGDPVEFAIGGRALDPFGRHFLFTGLIDEVEAFNRALTGAEIAAIFAAGSAGKCIPQANLCANVTCTASDQCHNAGTCDPATGMCSNPPKADGTACNDGNACTTGDSCQSGTCVGTPVTCTASDQCHSAGTCDPSTGVCSNPPKPNGSACNDGNACTTGDSCQSGTCVGTAVTCTASDQCHSAGTCNPSTGACSNPAKPDGTTCNDGDACTTNDVCTAGVCGGTTIPNCGPPTLGNYANKAMLLSTDGTDTPDAAPTNVVKITVSTSTNLKGKLEGYPSNGVVRITDAHPAGTYTVTVTGFNAIGQTTTKTFTLAVTTPATCATVNFAGAANFAAGNAPKSVAVGDFNGDGIQDVAVANPVSGTVSILLGNGDGTFTAANNFVAGSGSYSVVVGDFNGDGKQDLAVANQNSANVSILLGNGDGTFSGPNNFGVGSFPTSVAVGDFNGDGKQDLAVANQASNNVSILLGNGDGTFSAPNNFAAGSNPVSVAVGDFNGDGKQDLAVANQASNNVSILLGNGDGTFSAPNNFAAGNTPVSVAVGDFNGDGKQDLAVANLFSNNVSILLGNGDGTFGPPTNFGVGSFPDSVAVGDFNGDGRQDLAVANTSSNNVSILLRNCNLCAGVTCTASDQCHDVGICDPSTGQCSNPPKVNGSACNDGNACTINDVCTNGVCGGTPKTCTASDQCHDPGTCDPSNGVCSNPPKANGTTCNDGNLCTTNDVCTNGVCSGTPKTCTASDQCHDAGTCDPSSGVCSNPPKANGSVCNDGNACTTNDVCTNGVCGGTPKTCTASDQCHNAGTCDPTTGVCSNPPKPISTSITTNFNGTAISSGNYIWFNSVLKPSGLGSAPVTFRFTHQTISSSSFTLSVPDAMVTFDPAATTATTAFSGGMWVTRVPSSGLAGNTFFSALSYLVPANLPGGVKNVTWSGSVTSDTPTASLQWQWAAAVYTSFSANYSSLGVKPVDDNKASQYKNSDHAGTPENFTSRVTGGATGGGGSNYTGSYSGTGSVGPCSK